MTGRATVLPLLGLTALFSFLDMERPTMVFGILFAVVLIA